MTTQSKKAKGRNLQKLVVKTLLSKFTELKDTDVMSRSMGAGGEDVILSPRARELAGDLYIECKNVEKLNILSVFEETRLKAGNRVPVVVHKRNKINPVVILDLNKFIELL